MGEHDEATMLFPDQEEPTTDTSNTARSAVLVVLTGLSAGKVHRLDQQSFTIGRDAEADMRAEGNGVSRQHARLSKRDDGAIELTDLGSRNGTFCNGTRIATRVLESGDKIQIGDTTVLRFDYHDALEEEYQRRLYDSATRDALTGCFNKKYFMERLNAELAFAVRNAKPLSLAMFDVDFFKKVNDTHGHMAGDEVLRAVGATLRELARADDLVARYGGEEFALMMRDQTLEQALVAVERLRARVEALVVPVGGASLKVTLSGGIAVCHGGRLTEPTMLVTEADRYLYAAKKNGRNRIEHEGRSP